MFVAGGRVDRAIRTMLDRQREKWPEMVAALHGVDDGEFQPWHAVRDKMPKAEGEVYVARDAEMEQRWDIVGYSLMDHGEGPFGVLYRPAPLSTVDVQLEQDPYDHPYGHGFEPYPATLVTTGLSLITIVTPDNDSPFGRRLMEALGRALVDHARTE